MRARVSDFGLAKKVNPLTLLATAAGTLAFKPPEAFTQRKGDSCAGDAHLSLYKHRPAIAFQSGAADKQVPPDGATRFVAALKPVYAEAADRLVVDLEPDVPHRFTPRMLEDSIQWFAKHLKP